MTLELQRFPADVAGLPQLNHANLLISPVGLADEQAMMAEQVADLYDRQAELREEIHATHEEMHALQQRLGALHLELKGVNQGIDAGHEQETYLERIVRPAMTEHREPPKIPSAQLAIITPTETMRLVGGEIADELLPRRVDLTHTEFVTNPPEVAREVATLLRQAATLEENAQVVRDSDQTDLQPGFTAEAFAQRAETMRARAAEIRQSRGFHRSVPPEINVDLLALKGNSGAEETISRAVLQGEPVAEAPADQDSNKSFIAGAFSRWRRRMRST